MRSGRASRPKKWGCGFETDAGADGLRRSGKTGSGFPEKDRTFRIFLAVLALLPSLSVAYVPSLGITGGLFLSILLLSFYPFKIKS